MPVSISCWKKQKLEHTFLFFLIFGATGKWPIYHFCLHTYFELI